MASAKYRDDSPVGRFTEEINDHLKERFGYKNRCAHSGLGTVSARTAKMDIYLRFPELNGTYQWFDQPNTLVIARIQFTSQRAGHGTWLLGLLVQLAPKYGYTSLALEYTVSADGIQNFVRKFGFTPVPPEAEDRRHWIVPVSELELLLFPLALTN